MNEGVPYSKYAIVGAAKPKNDALYSRIRQELDGHPSVEFVDRAWVRLPGYEFEPSHSNTCMDRHELRLGLSYGLEKTALEKSPDLIFCNGSAIDPVVEVRALGDLEESERLYASIHKVGWPSTYKKFFVTEPNVRNKRHDTLLSVLLEKRLPLVYLDGGIDKMVDDVMHFLRPKYAHQVNR